MIIAIDIENGQAFGPFDSHEQADERIAGFMVELGEWRRGTSPLTDTPLQVALEHFLDEEAGAEGHEDQDSCRAVLCQAVDEAGWMVTEMSPLHKTQGPVPIEIESLEPGDGMGDDLHPARPEAPESNEALIQAQVDLGYEQHIAEMRTRAAQAAPGEQPVALSEDAASTRHDSHSHDAADGADGRDAHAS